MAINVRKICAYIGASASMGRSVGVLAGIGVSILLGIVLVGSGNTNNPSQYRSRLSWWSTKENDARSIAEPHLTWAAEKCLSEVELPIQHLRAVFANARSQSRNFAEEALGWDSKLTIVSDYLQQRNDHAEFLRRKFANFVISEQELLSAVEQGLGEFQQATLSIEGEMLVRLRSDAQDFENSPLRLTTDNVVLQSLFQKAISQSGSAAGVDLQAAVGREVASFVLGEIATQVAVQLGVSSGILSVAAGTGWTNFGISLAAGLVVDKIITAAYDAYADPKGQLASQINAQLDEMERVIIEGTEREAGLRARLQQFARERSTLRESAVLQLLTGKQGGVL